jgi:hypothetical protein
MMKYSLWSRNLDKIAEEFEVIGRKLKKET